jgi:AAA ATPase domain
LTALVGREEELELLLRRWAKAKTGEGQVVLLSGEAGIGKSRLTAALLERLANEPHIRLRDISAMIDRVVGDNLLPGNIRQDIIERTDGIPLFVEEMTKAVLEAGSEGAAQRTAAAIPSPRLAVPASLQASLMARLDRPTVLLNEESPFLIEAIRYHQEQYPEIYASEVEKIVRTTYGEVAVCKVAHSQKLIAQIPEEELDAIYRSEAALTVSLMGLLAEESLIAQRLGKLGRKKTAA